jgi:hypothetical protein
MGPRDTRLILELQGEYTTGYNDAGASQSDKKVRLSSNLMISLSVELKQGKLNRLG